MKVPKQPWIVAKLLKTVPLHLILVVPFVVQLGVAVGLTGYLSFRNGQTSINMLVEQLQNEVTARINQKLTNYLENAHRVNQINADAIASGVIKLDQLSTLEPYLKQQLLEFDTVNSIVIATEQPDYIGLGYNDGDRSSFYLSVWNSAQGGTFDWMIDAQGQRILLGKDREYDHRQRSWYQETVDAGKPIWNEIFTSITPVNLILSANQPVYDAEGRLLGVTSTDLGLEQMNQFLRSLNISKTGQAFIIERNGALIANSTTHLPYKVVDQGEALERINAVDSQDELVQQTATHLFADIPDLAGLHQSQRLNFAVNKQQFFVSVLPFSDPRGIDWLIVVVIPESDFMQQINANTRTTILLCLLAVVVAIGVGLVTARLISEPLHRLSEASRKIADGDLEQTITVNSIQELEVLSQSFNRMATQLKQAFADLEDRVQCRTAELAAAKDMAESASQVKSEFLAQMSHELRTPLNIILGFTQVMRCDAELTPHQQEAIATIERSGEHLLSLINQLLAASKTGTIHIQSPNYESATRCPILNKAQAAELQTALLAMPPEWISALHIAAIKGLDQQVLHLVEQMPEPNSPLATTLSQWVQDFQFNRILVLIQQVTQ